MQAARQWFFILFQLFQIIWVLDFQANILPADYNNANNKSGCIKNSTNLSSSMCLISQKKNFQKKWWRHLDRLNRLHFVKKNKDLFSKPGNQVHSPTKYIKTFSAPSQQVNYLLYNREGLNFTGSNRLLLTM